METGERELRPGEHKAIISGENLDSVASIGFGPGVEVADLQQVGDRLSALIKVAPDAAEGTRAMEFHDKQGNRGEFKDAITIRRAAAEPPAPPERPKKTPTKRGQRDRGEEV